MTSALMMRRRVMGKAVVPFSPSDVAGLKTWLKADGSLWQDSARTVAAAADGDPVGGWDDASGLANHASQATAAAKPTLRLNVVNSKPVVRFDGVDDLLTLAATFDTLTAGNVFLVVKIVADPPAAQTRTGLWNFEASGAGSSHYPWTDGTIYDSFGTNLRKTTVNPAPLLTAWRLYEVVSASGEWTSHLDGSQLFTTATNTVGFAAAPLIGRAADATYWLDGDIAEMIVYDNKIASGDRSNVRSHLATKYGLTVA